MQRDLLSAERRPLCREELSSLQRRSPLSREIFPLQRSPLCREEISPLQRDLPSTERRSPLAPIIAGAIFGAAPDFFTLKIAVVIFSTSPHVFVKSGTANFGVPGCTRGWLVAEYYSSNNPPHYSQLQELPFFTSEHDTGCENSHFIICVLLIA